LLCCCALASGRALMSRALSFEDTSRAQAVAHSSLLMAKVILDNYMVG